MDSSKENTPSSSHQSPWAGRLRVPTRKSCYKESDSDSEDVKVVKTTGRVAKPSERTRKKMKAEKEDNQRELRRRNESVERNRKRLERQRNYESNRRAEESQHEADERRRKNRIANRSRRSTSCGAGRRDEAVEEHYLGSLSIQCLNCEALHYQDEVPQSNAFNSCCRHGLVALPMFEHFPDELQKLYIENTPNSRHFRENLRSYNNSLAMASMKAQLDVPQGHGPYCFRLHGQVYHLIGPLHPAEGEDHVFAQIFILDTDEAAEELAQRPVNRQCSEDVFKELIRILNETNPFVKAYKMMFEKEKEEQDEADAENREKREVRMVFQQREQETVRDPRRYQIPTASEVAVVYVGDDSEIPGVRAVTVYQRSGQLQSLRSTDPETDPLCYPLLFPDGKAGWHFNLKYVGAKTDGRQRISAREFYSYYFHVRPKFNPLHHAGKLFQQFCVDMWTKIEQDRLNFARLNQDKLRVESLQGLEDYVHGEENGPLGSRIILPASFTGSPRDMVCQYQDAMTVVSKYGKPDLFITVTCNPRWKEIQEALAPGQSASDRPDIVTRVFKLKIDELKKDLFERNIFGEVVAWIYVVEFQKRGLPHIHMLLILKHEWKLRSAADVDSILCAELPDQAEDPDLFEKVSRMMIHRPCGVHNPRESCMRDGRCTKNFPKEFRNNTSVDVDGYPLYRRRDDGRSLMSGGVKLDSRSVVPYNTYLLRKFNCHINVEVCGTVGAVKYLYKYVYKGTTRASIHIFTDSKGVQHEVANEIDSYLDTRYVCAPEALHHVFGYRMSDRNIAVVQLKVHLPGGQGIIYEKGHEKEALEKMEFRNTTLTAWFEANKRWKDMVENGGSSSTNVPDTSGLLYTEMPEHFIYEKGRWKPRARATRAIGRMYFVSPRDRERFAMRLILLNTTGATSFEDLRTVNGQIHDKFADAARAAGYLTDDSFYESSLEEAAGFHSASQLRGFFATLLYFGEINNAENLWNKFIDHLCEDFEHQGQPRSKAEALAYHDIGDRLSAMGEDISKWMKLPYARDTVDDVIDHEQCRRDGEEMLMKLTSEQKKVVQAALDALGHGGQIFVDGPGGSGKTFVYTCLINIIQGMRKKVISVAWTGIAAALLPEGRTVASIFKLNVNDGCRSSSLHHQSAEARRLAAADVIMWDEAPMSPKASLETVDQLLRDITQRDSPFGGKVVVLGGDFRQCLPVVDKGGIDEQVANSIKKSKIWPLFHTIHLTTNMRVSDGDDDWKQYLLDIGDGKLGEDTTGEMEVPEELRSEGDLAVEVFGDMLHGNADVAELARVAILTPRNREALAMNSRILEMIPGEARVYKSIDQVGEKKDHPASDATNFPTEFLNRMTPQGMPPHTLELKKGAIIMLLRNLDVKNSLCNGTRFVVEEMGQRVLRCTFVCGARQGESVLLPRIKLSYSTNLPFTLERHQFPIRLSFAMTINKSQGQTFDKIGLMLEEPIFSHGQLYVALSRTRRKDGVHIANEDKKMNNIVVKHVL